MGSFETMTMLLLVYKLEWTSAKVPKIMTDVHQKRKAE